MTAARRDIRTEVRGAVGLITLDRGQALNALTHDMVLAIATALDEWEADHRVACVVVHAAEGPAFSAGGDIRKIIEAGMAAKLGEKASPMRFFFDEYRLNHRIHTYPKPYISLMNGIVMGGGAGISINGRYRVAGPDVRFAMPEVGIGFFPDVGGTYFLPRLPSECGVYLALTGAQIGQADCLWTGLATHAASPDAFPEILDELARGAAPDAVLNRLDAGARETMEDAPLSFHAERIAIVFGQDQLDRVLSSLEYAQGEGWVLADRALKAIGRASPTSLRLAFRQMLEGRTMEFADCLRMEYRIVSRILEGHDFYEGVRAQILDKDRNPRWAPASLSEVTEREIERYFEPLEAELEFP